MDIDIKQQHEQALSIFQALSHVDRLKMIEIIESQNVPINHLKQELQISSSSLSKHLKILEKADLISLIYGKDEFRKQKFVSLKTDTINIHFPQRVFPELSKIRESVRIGHFVDFSATPSCGLATSENIIGRIDHSKSFLHQNRVNASLIWLSQGFLEYKIPKPLKNGDKIEMLDISLEIASEFPISNNTWPTNLNLVLNNIPIGTLVIPGNFSDVRGIYTPSWWADEFSQYGLLKHIRINHSDTSIDGVKVSDHNLTETKIEDEDFITFRIEVEEIENRYGGLTIFGENWGNHPQDINFDFYVS
ncbi:transcriptional regulator [Streptococcus pluranimalium]|uniref:transcriptional regulator n=1 Tax=Streptococcus pluranimalium TaxID=82348 RepID=UPI003F694D84